MGGYTGPDPSDPNNMVGLMLTLFQQVWEEVINLWGYIFQAFDWVYQHLQLLLDWIVRGLKALGSALWRALQALGHLNFRAIWNALKRAYERFQRALRWYQKHVQEPLDRIRRTIMDLYNRFWRPILRMLDSFRVFIRLLSIFNRQLAAKLDGALFSLEAKLMYPITAVLQRVNELSSYVRAIITASGLLDRVLTLETLRRDASLVWEVLTNPRARIYEPIVKPQPYTYDQLKVDVGVFASTGAGPIADYIDQARVNIRDAGL